MFVYLLVQITTTQGRAKVEVCRDEMAMESHLLGPCFVGAVYETFCDISFLYNA
jgi:hypothetical protein